MSGPSATAPDAAQPAEPSSRPSSLRFRPKRVDIRLPADEASRQGAIVQLAFQALPEPGAAAAFLNTVHPDLGGRPIDVAIASADGYAAVSEALALARG